MTLSHRSQCLVYLFLNEYLIEFIAEQDQREFVYFIKCLISNFYTSKSFYLDNSSDKNWLTEYCCDFMNDEMCGDLDVLYCSVLLNIGGIFLPLMYSSAINFE